MEKSPNRHKKNRIHSSQKYLKEKKEDNNNFFNNLYNNLPFFSYKVLEAKHSSTPELYQQILLNNLILRKKNHLLAYLNEININTNIFKEFLKRLYIYNESRERIPKYVSYYQNYLKFFCRPVFADFYTNKKMVKHMEKVAQIFYNENYAEEDEAENPKKHEKFQFKVFNKTVREEIENFDNYTIEDDNAENNKFCMMKNSLNKNKDIKFKTIDNKKNNFKYNDLDKLENIYKITPIFDNNKNKKYKEEKYKKTEYDSFQKILKEMENKKNIKSKEGPHKKSNKLSSHNSNILDYFNSLSSNLFARKKKAYIHKNNSINNKYYKKIDKNNFNLNNNKIINNINININHLTIGQKSINPLYEISNNHNNNYTKKYKKRNLKSRKSNSMILKDKSFKKFCFGNLTSKYSEQKKRNNSYKNFSQGNNGIIGYNSNKQRKNTNINYTNILSNTRNKPNFKSIKYCQINNGFITSLHKYNNKKKNKDNYKKNLGKMTIYTNISNIIKNMYNVMDINNNSKKLKHSNYNSNSINFSHKNLHINSFYKNSTMSFSPLYLNRRHKNNLSLNKAISFINNERVRSTSNKLQKQKKLFNSGFNYKSGNKNMVNNSHIFISPKNNKINLHLSKLKINKNEKSHDSRDISSPIYRENISNINKYNSFLKKKKKIEIQKIQYSKAINLKFRHFTKLTNLNNPKKSRNKSKSKSKGKK